MVTRPELLMLDEPAAGLNPKETDELDHLIVELRDRHKVSVLLIEHDMKLVMGISDRIYVVNQGTPLAQGTPAEIRNNPDVIRAYLGGLRLCPIIVRGIVADPKPAIKAEDEEHSGTMFESDNAESGFWGATRRVGLFRRAAALLTVYLAHQTSRLAPCCAAK